MNSQASGLSQNSDYSDDGEEAPPEKQEPGQPKGEESLFSKLQNEDQPASKDDTKDAAKELLQNDPESQMPASSGGDYVNNKLTSDGGGEIFAEARQIAGLRQMLKDEDPGMKGPEFKQNVWEYYKVKASWSDGMCVALNHGSMVPCLFIPCLFPVRLFQTIRRAAPVKIKMCKCCQFNCGTCCGGMLVFIIFSLKMDIVFAKVLVLLLLLENLAGASQTGSLMKDVVVIVVASIRMSFLLGFRKAS